jgi:SAM-dependent MidA family methyltransferase
MSASANLAERLLARIEHDGPISFYEWMKAALYDEHEGYYCRADRVPQGRAGDYRTGPEISPLFTATFADYFPQLHTDLKWPGSWTIFEMGAGADTLHRACSASCVSTSQTSLRPPAMSSMKSAPRREVAQPIVSLSLQTG